MEHTRIRIQQYLAESHSASAKELSRILDMTTANIRYHLEMMRREGQVLAESQRRKSGRGRPEKIYRLGSRGRENSLGELAAASFNILSETKNVKNRDANLKQVASNLAGIKKGTGAAPGRLRAAVKRLNELRYHAHWEAHTEGPKIIFNSCPYAQIIEDQPLLCRMDELLLESMLGFEMEQTAKINQHSMADVVCIFKSNLQPGTQPPS